MTDLSYGAAVTRTAGGRTTYRYTTYQHKASKRGSCPTCGKKTTRNRTFTATQNPFNRNPATGEPRTPEQIRVDLVEQADGWAPDFQCASHNDDPAPAVGQSHTTTKETTAATVASLRALCSFVERTGLPLSSLTTSHSGGFTIYVSGARAMAIWANSIGAPHVRIQRRPGVDTCMWAEGKADGIEIRLWGAYSLILAPTDDVEWTRDRRGKRTDRGRMTTAAVAALPEVDR